MPRCAKLGWTVRGVALPLLLSLMLHGLLFLALWFWPARTSSPPLTIASTRITLDTRVLESRSATLLPAEHLPADLRGPTVQTTLAPRLEKPPPTVRNPNPVPVPDGGTGKGNGNGKNILGIDLFPLPATAASVVYVLDRSVSMGMDRKLDFARRELIASLRRLPPAVRFQVIDYNDYAESLVLDGRRGLLPAEPAIIDWAVSRLKALDARGKTNHLAALRRGLELRPDVLYFLTDADDLEPETVASITQRNHGSVIHTIELTRRRALRPEGPLARLAYDNRGTYRRVSLGD